MTARLKEAGVKLLKLGPKWATIKFAFFLGAVFGMLYVGGLIYAVQHYGPDATIQKVRSLSGGRL
jgi:hypothetical protein